MASNRPSSRKSNNTSTSGNYSSKQQPSNEDTLSSARQRQSKRDEAIRRKAEQDLKKKRQPNHSTSQRNSKRIPGTVSALKPSPALTVSSHIKVTEASQMMAAKRADCVLVVDEDEHLAGIFTAKDLAYRVVAEGLDARTTSVANIMTPNPLCVTTDASASDALNTMVQRGFRHLPVCNEEGDIVGLLDITKCLYDALDKMDRAYGSSKKLVDALEGVEKEWAMQAPQFLQLMGSLKDQINCPDVSTLLDGTLPADITPKTTVKEAAKAMKASRSTAVLVMENETIAGIFTSKDIVLRVIAAQLEPSNCSVVRVMTPHPDTALPETTILDALKRMHHGHYLNLPIVDQFKQVVGMVDVLKLTYATLEQIHQMQGGTNSLMDGENGSNPLWNKFWSTAFTNDEDSVISDSTQPTRVEASEVYPHESVSAIDEDPEILNNSNNAQQTFTFKFKAPSNKVYRLTSNQDDFEMLRQLIVTKLIEENPNLSIEMIPPLSYVDDEGDQVLLLNDEDLKDAVKLARQNGWHRILLSLSESIESLLLDNKSDNQSNINNKEDNNINEKEIQHQQLLSNLNNNENNNNSTVTEESISSNNNASNTLKDSIKSESKDEPLIPQHLQVPVALGSGFLIGLIGVMIMYKVTSK